MPKPVVTLYQAMKNFVRFLPGFQNFLPQIPENMGTKICSYLRTGKKAKAVTKEGNITISIYIFQIDKIQNFGIILHSFELEEGSQHSFRK